MNNRLQNREDEKNMKRKQFVVMVNNGISNEVIVGTDRETVKEVKAPLYWYSPYRSKNA